MANMFSAFQDAARMKMARDNALLASGEMAMGTKPVQSVGRFNPLRMLPQYGFNPQGATYNTLVPTGQSKLRAALNAAKLKSEVAGLKQKPLDFALKYSTDPLMGTQPELFQNAMELYNQQVGNIDDMLSGLGIDALNSGQQEVERLINESGQSISDLVKSLEGKPDVEIPEGEEGEVDVGEGNEKLEKAKKIKGVLDEFQDILEENNTSVDDALALIDMTPDERESVLAEAETENPEAVSVLREVLERMLIAMAKPNTTRISTTRSTPAATERARLAGAARTPNRVPTFLDRLAEGARLAAERR